MVLHLKGKTALVTGASIGIGRVIAKALASKGVQVVAVARRTELLEAMADQVPAVQQPLKQDGMSPPASARPPWMPSATSTSW
jgi:3-oxoacyl-[acyl-carrier protein] reductase